LKGAKTEHKFKDKEKLLTSAKVFTIKRAKTNAAKMSSSFASDRKKNFAPKFSRTT